MPATRAVVGRLPPAAAAGAGIPAIVSSLLPVFPAALSAVQLRFWLAWGGARALGAPVALPALAAHCEMLQWPDEGFVQLRGADEEHAESC